MPRDLGKAGRKDLAGSLPGEEREFVSGIVRFLEGAGQLSSPRPGSFRDNGGNGRHGHDTEVTPGGNGRGKPTESVRADSDTLFDQPLMIDDVRDALLTPEPADAQPDSSLVEELYSVPDLTSPELDLPRDDETDTAPPRNRRGMPTLKPELHELPPSGDTGLLEMDATPMDESGLDDAVEDETGILPRDDEDQRVTSKVDHRTEGDPRWQPTNPDMRDTVNFYNQTQSLSDKRGSFPTISPSEVSGRHPMDLSPEDLPDPGELHGLEPSSGGDTARVPDEDRHVLPSKPVAGSSESTSLELQQEGDLPPGHALGGSSDTAGDFTGSKTAPLPRRKVARPTDREPLPPPVQVRADFELRPEGLPSERIVPELITSDTAEPDASFFEEELAAPMDEAVEEKAEKVTEKVGKELAAAINIDEALPKTAPLPTRKPEPKSPPATVRVQPEANVPRVTDALARRIREEREETLRLIRQAEDVAARLREAGEVSRRELAALSARTNAPKVAASGAVLNATPSSDQRPTQPLATPPLSDEFDAVPPGSPDTPRLPAVPTPADSGRTTRRRVPTQAIGDLVERIEEKLASPASLAEIIRQASQRIEHAPPTAFAKTRQDDAAMDLDELVAASAALRESVESEWDEDRRSGLLEAVPMVPMQPSGQLQAIWEEVDSPLPQPLLEERARITATPAEVGLGWTQESLWKTLLALGLVTVALAGAFGFAVWYFLQR